MTQKKKRGILIGYSVCLIVVVILKFYGNFSEFCFQIQTNISYFRHYHELLINLIPFRTIQMYILDFPDVIALKNLLGNIIPWIPLGLLWRWNFPQTKGTRIVLGLVVFSVLGELLQLVTFTGSFDVDDCILNLLGCLIGWGLWKVGCRYYSH